jgi:hypothetical protein
MQMARLSSSLRTGLFLRLELRRLREKVWVNDGTREAFVDFFWLDLWVQEIDDKGSS